ncbi:MAG: DNA-3-methyladenine glycosylase 2 family protein [Burkholderiales bacterium]|nr:DNA-3-methyladenine glycosylase 2 family protein [Burkholderiales bacterium]
MSDTDKEFSEPPCTPLYWEEAKAELMKRDRIMRKLIPQFSNLQLIGRDDPFTTLTRSIVAQQISNVAADGLWRRFLELCPKSTPAQVLRLGNEKLFSCGLSKRKTEYILDLAEHFKEKRLHVDKWGEMGDEDVILELIQIRGIGRWTAEMFLIFNLHRPNILPLDDPGLLKGISINYFSGEPVSRSDVREVAANWEPWRTVATWYLWRSLDPV